MISIHKHSPPSLAFVPWLLSSPNPHPRLSSRPPSARRRPAAPFSSFSPGFMSVQGDGVGLHDELRILSETARVLPALNWGRLFFVGDKGGTVAPETLMNSRRSKSVKLVSTRSKPLEVEITEEDGRMSSSANNTVYCCIAKGKKVIYCYNSKDGDPQIEATAALCLENTPSYHRHYIHTSGSRSYGYLIADGHTFFAIIDPSVGNVGALQFLERVRDAFRSTNSRNGFHDSLVPAVQRLVASLEKMPHAAFVLEESVEGGGSNDNSSCTSSKVPLLGKSGSRKDKKKAKEKPLQVADDEDEQHGTRDVRIDVPQEEVAGMSLERSTSQSRLRRQPTPRSLWMRHLKIIIVVDALICLALFGAWLAVCKGFQCVSGR